MKSPRLARRYARALFTWGLERQQAEALGEELARLTAFLQEEEDLWERLHHPRIPAPEKKEFFRLHLQSRFPPVLLRFLELLIEKGRTPLLPTIVEEYRRLQDEAQGIVRGEMVSAISLTPEEIERYRRRLEEITGKKVALTYRVDSSLIAGATFRVGDRLIDASVRAYLREVRERLKRTRVVA